MLRALVVAPPVALRLINKPAACVPEVFVRFISWASAVVPLWLTMIACAAVPTVLPLTVRATTVVVTGEIVFCKVVVGAVDTKAPEEAA